MLYSAQKLIFYVLFAYLLHPGLRVAYSKPNSISYPFNKPNPYVRSSPPCLAASCNDGISLLVIHIPESPMADNIGPIRVEQIDEHAVLLNAGWRVDGAVLAETAREICNKDTATYGNSEQDMNYGTRLGWGLVEYLVDCHVKNSSRSLATISLLATNASSKNELYLVDVTGLYPCRAIAIGSHSEQINRFLAKVDFRDKTSKEGSEILLSILRDCRKGKIPSVGDGKGMENVLDDNAWHIPDSSVVEVVLVQTEKGAKTIQRRREIFLPQESS